MNTILSSENGPESHFMAEFFNMLLILGLIVMMLYFGAWMFRRLMAQRNEQLNTTNNIKVIEQRNLSPKSALYIIEVSGKTFMISESVNGVKFLTELSATFETDEP